ncbi:hypothetical protein SDRG_10203 [Saprolegnia diclina VS20]|uniref:Uncharacterized protein n=1 Tax=Saprolegnia diclina (strain VS20) TaxID=1156394 RepID=T0RI85_SAPDV|nr:hypothetical protein SDRG_10203 [Saprolegnia diclina VS20]EQC32003.1 hypothetical protein SDRG_10203 [Saprolegnia diclina VS20]|eukprot:XP_008614405.1 hypothetical protein SDRG_10203 [Saprolegnia diclina VS20]
MEAELARLEALRDSSRDLVAYLESAREQFDAIQEENEKALRIMENWHAVFAIANGVARIQSASETSGGFSSVPATP